jgi:hypothetical protein
LKLKPSVDRLQKKDFVAHGLGVAIENCARFPDRLPPASWSVRPHYDIVAEPKAVRHTFAETDPGTRTRLLFVLRKNHRPKVP